jgi:2-aminoadipate transaminase
MTVKGQAIPLYQILADEISSRIAAGRYRPGEKIPSIRKLAAEFGCNKLTVQKAFDRLRRDGLLENLVGSGSFVRFPEIISRCQALFDFKTSYISECFFPYLEARTIFSALFDREKTGALAPTPAEGDPELIKLLSEQFQVPTRGMLVISGAQQGLDLTAKVFSTRISDTILFEDPTYPGAISLFKARHFVPMEPDGPMLSALDAKLSDDIRLFYTMPSVHNPTGRSYSLEKKHAVGRRAHRRSFYIIEDDYLSEFSNHSVARFVDLFPEKTIYIKSLSQTTAAGIRLGFMVVPDALYEKFIFTKYASDLASSGLLQKFLAAFIRSGAYDRYVAQTRQRIKQRKTRLLKLAAGFSSLTVCGAQSGYSLWICSANPVRLAHPPWSAGKDFSFDSQFRDCFRISFMNMDDACFDKGLSYLGQLFERIEAGFREPG